MNKRTLLPYIGNIYIISSFPGIELNYLLARGPQVSQSLIPGAIADGILGLGCLESA